MPYRAYLRAVNKRFGLLGTWLPGQKIALGDIGTLDKGVFTRENSIAALGYALEEEASDVPVDFDHSSGTSIAFGVGGNADAAGVGPAGIGHAEARIKFGSAGAFVFRAAGCIEHAFVTHAFLTSALRELRARGSWDDGWVVIDRLYVANALTVLVCTSDSGSAKIAAKAGPQAGPFDIAGVELGLTASTEEGDVTRVVGTRGIVPMYSACRLRTGFFWSDRIESKKVELRAGEIQELVTVTLQDALNEA